MNICFYSPYLPNHFGGGEKHLLDVALAASHKHSVSIAISKTRIYGNKSLDSIKQTYQNYFNYDLSKITFITTPLGTKARFTTKIFWTKKHDALYYVTDGSLFFSLAKHNYLHIQTPLTVKKNNFIERLKLINWSHKNTNSEFTKHVIEQAWNTTVNTVLNPMINIYEFETSVAKKKQILSVGRFFKHLHAKRQDVMIEMFIKMSQQYPRETTGWRLVLAGSVEDQNYLQSLKQKAEGHNIIIETDISRDRLINLYSSSEIYWHAAGFEIDEVQNPEKVEHFGISTVEAMAAGAIPLVQYKGGQKEVLGKELKNLGWLTKEECESKTLDYITSSEKRVAMRKLVQLRATQFSKSIFEKNVDTLFKV